MVNMFSTEQGDFYWSRKNRTGLELLKTNEITGTPLVAGTHGPVTRLVVVSSVKFVPADAGQKTIVRPPPVPTVNGGKTLVDTTASESGWSKKPPRLSVARTLKLNVPLVMSEPDRSPSAASVRFAGGLPNETVQL